MTLAVLCEYAPPGEAHSTAYGMSSPLAALDLAGRPVWACPPGLADPRATIQALHERGVTHLWLAESVGALSPLLEAGDWLVPDDYIDGTRGQYYTFFDEKAGGYVQQVPAFDPASRSALLAAAASAAPRPFRRGVYVCVSRDRLETPAEAQFWGRAGAHVAGRYLSPWLTLARERQMAVAVLASVERAGGEPATAAENWARFAPLLETAARDLE